MTAKNILALLALLLLAGAGVYWFLENFEQIEIPAPSSASGEAKTNHLYAAERFLQAMGMPADSLPASSLKQALPPTNSAIVLDERSKISASLSETLLDWVRRGGTLIATPHENPDQPLAKLLGEANESDRSAPATSEEDLPLSAVGIYADYQPRNEAGDDNEYLQLAKLVFRDDNGNPQVVTVERIPAYGLKGERPGDLVVREQGGIFMIQRPLGEGQLIAVSELYMLSNDAIGAADNAAFLWGLLTEPGLNIQQVLLITPGDEPALWQLLWQHARPLIIASALLLAFWLLAGLARFGPLLPPAQQPRRQLLEHIRASGQLYWREGQSQRLLDATRHAVLTRLFSQHPHLKTLHDSTASNQASAELIQAIAELSGESHTRIEALLTRPAARERSAFTAQIQQLETLRHRL